MRAIYIVIGSNERMIRRDHVKLHTFAPGIIQDEHWRGTRPFLFLFSMSFIILALLFSLSLLRIVVAQIRGPIAGSSPPLPTTVRALLFCRKKISTLLSSLVDSHRSVLTRAINGRSQQLILFFFCFNVFANKFGISPRRDSNSRTNTSSIRAFSTVL